MSGKALVSTGCAVAGVALLCLGGLALLGYAVNEAEEYWD